MIKSFKSLFYALVISFSFSAFSQGNQNGTSVADDSMRDLLIVGGTGAMGAVLGLSTLSFVEEPSEHLKNIYMGASLGIILGVSYVAYTTANKEQELMVKAGKNAPVFSTKDRVVWHKTEFNKMPSDHSKHKYLELNFKF